MSTETDLIKAIIPAAPDLAGKLVRRNALDEQTFKLIQLLAPSFHVCRWYGLASPEQAVVVMAKAVDLGIPFTAAFDFFEVIENKPTLKPVGALALIHRDGRFDMKVDDTKPDRCVVWMRRRDTGFEHTVTYTVDDAKAAGLIRTDKAGAAWSRFLTDMLRNRAVGRCARIVAPDVLAGCYLSTDFDAALEQQAQAAAAGVDVKTGEVIDAEVQP
jgi:hypothetical protein